MILLTVFKLRGMQPLKGDAFMHKGHWGPLFIVGSAACLLTLLNRLLSMRSCGSEHGCLKASWAGFYDSLGLSFLTASRPALDREIKQGGIRAGMNSSAARLGGTTARARGPNVP